MKTPFLRLLAICSLLLLSGRAVYAVDIATPGCLEQTFALLAMQQREFRGVLFGIQPARTLPHESVRYRSDNTPFVKTADNRWTTADGTTLTDAQMDQQAFPPVRRGLFEVRQMLTSERIPSILQSARALQCRLKAVCLAANASQKSDPDALELLQVQPDGCISFTFRSIPSCAITSPPEDNASHQLVVSTTCDQAAHDIFTQEVQMVRMVTIYDAAYRSLLQFSGILRQFDLSLNTPIFEVLTKAVNALKEFSAIPCFSAQCDE